MATLNIIIGIPGSGKSNYAKKYLLTNNSVYLSSDDIRVELYGFEDQTHNDVVFETMKKRTLNALKEGKDVIYDATNLNKKRRSGIINEAHKLDAQVDAYLCCTPINIILERNITRAERQLPWDKLVQMIQSIEPPMYYEEFDNIYLIDGGMYNDVYDYNFLIKECSGYNQNNPHHYETLEEHIKAVTKKAENLGETLKLRNDAEILRQAARYHDFGKLYTKSFNDKKGHYVYYGHDKVSTYLYLCHIRKQNLIDELNRVRLCDRHYQTAALILNHMEWYRREDMTPIKELFNDDDLYYMLELLHEADLWGRNENAKEVVEW
ncbi:MAG: AAA family ATPase [Candidatus Coprovivens sp.]